MSAGYRLKPKGFATKAIHTAQDPDQWSSKSIATPICLSTIYKQDTPGQNRGFMYARANNPTRQVLEQCVAALDNAKHGLTFASGLGAENAAISILSCGDHIVVGDDNYSGTNSFINKIAVRFGIEATFADATNLTKFKAAFRPNTKMVWLETASNPLTKVPDIQAISEMAHQAGNIIVAVDNTFLSPYLCRPLELGADLVCYSFTKYMCGHNDVTMGGITTNSSDLFNRLKLQQRVGGIIPSPFDCYLLIRSLKTLALRMEQHQKNALEIATFLERHPMVEKVQHPSLPSHPQHQLALKQFYGYSGIFSFYLRGALKHSKVFFESLQTILLAGSLGGSETVTELPAVMSHDSMSEAERAKLGITDNLIRISVGLEDIDDLIADLGNALQAVQQV